jgi:hypothetical protein
MHAFEEHLHVFWIHLWGYTVTQVGDVAASFAEPAVAIEQPFHLGPYGILRTQKDGRIHVALQGDVLANGVTCSERFDCPVEAYDVVSGFGEIWEGLVRSFCKDSHGYAGNVEGLER